MKTRIYIINDITVLTSKKFQQYILELEMQNVTVKVFTDKHEENFFLQQEKRSGLIYKALERNKFSEYFLELTYSTYNVTQHVGNY